MLTGAGGWEGREGRGEKIFSQSATADCWLAGRIVLRHGFVIGKGCRGVVIHTR